jgi:hypothetical protein
MRVCQFRHDGNLICNAAAAAGPPSQEDQRLYFTGMSETVKPPCPNCPN